MNQKEKSDASRWWQHKSGGESHKNTEPENQTENKEEVRRVRKMCREEREESMLTRENENTG